MIDLKLFKNYFEYLSPSDMYKNLNETRNMEQNKVLVNMIRKSLAGLIEKFKSSPTSNAKKLKQK